MYTAYLYGSRSKKFAWGTYLLLILTPVLCSLSLAYFYGIKVIVFFVSSSIIGFILEYLLGLIYYKTLGEKLWAYSRYNVGEFTSLLTFPMWGVAGVIFWLLSKEIGL
jgi:uncharacterized membrane protein